MSESNLGFAPDHSFPNEILVSGTLEMASVGTASAKMSQMSDLIGPVGMVEGKWLFQNSFILYESYFTHLGKLHLKIGRGPKDITVRSAEYRGVIVHDGVHRITVLLPAAIPTTNIKRGGEIVFHKIRLLRFSDGEYWLRTRP
jgi:hypothetical protein